MNLNTVIPISLEITINIPVFLCIIRLIDSNLAVDHSISTQSPSAGLHNCLCNYD